MKDFDKSATLENFPFCVRFASTGRDSYLDAGDTVGSHLPDEILANGLSMAVVAPEKSGKTCYLDAFVIALLMV